MKPVEWPEPREKPFRSGVIRWYGPCLAEHEDWRTVWMIGVLRECNRRMGVEPRVVRVGKKKRRKR